MRRTKWAAILSLVGMLAPLAPVALAWCAGCAPWDPRHGGGGYRGPTGPSAAEIRRQQYTAKMKSVWGQTDQTELTRVAIAEQDVDVRRAAAGRLTDPMLIKKVYAESTDVEVRVIMVWRLRGVVLVEKDAPADVIWAATNSAAIKEQKVDLGDGVMLDLVWIPPGEFTMGSPADETGRDVDETQHKVTISGGYWMGKHEVTQRQYQQLMGGNPSNFKNAGPDAPVESVNWTQAKAFCDKLDARLPAKMRGKTARLPTEAEWEYACRARTTTALNSGKPLTAETGRCADLDEVAWYDENSAGATHPVEQKKPNAWGLYDMHGNVWEWCGDGYGPYPNGAVADPTGRLLASSHVCRGGGWINRAGLGRSASRSWYDPVNRNSRLGFRVVVGR